MARGVFSWAHVRSITVPFDRLSSSVNLKEHEIEILDAELQGSAVRLQTLNGNIAMLQELLLDLPIEDEVYEGLMESLQVDMRKRQELLEKRNRRDVAPVELNVLNSRLLPAREALREALRGFNRKTTATIKGPTDLRALEMFRYWGGDPITFKISPWIPADEAYVVERDLRPFFRNSGLVVETRVTFQMDRHGRVTRA